MPLKKQLKAKESPASSPVPTHLNREGGEGSRKQFFHKLEGEGGKSKTKQQQKKDTKTKQTKKKETEGEPSVLLSPYPYRKGRNRPSLAEVSHEPIPTIQLNPPENYFCAA